MNPSTGKMNNLCDVSGILVGNAEDTDALTGVTSILFDKELVASCYIAGGAPGTRETPLLEPTGMVPGINGIILSGGSVFGLDAAGEVCNLLKKKNIGFKITESLAMPIVPAAILFDWLNGGKKEGLDGNQYRDLARQSMEHLSTDIKNGNYGAGLGAKAGNLKGGLGSASILYKSNSEEIIISSLAAVNSFGNVCDSDGKFYAENLIYPEDCPNLTLRKKSNTWKYQSAFFNTERNHGESTTLCVIATNARLSKTECAILAKTASAGLARAINPVMTQMDGDIIFAVSSGEIEYGNKPIEMANLSSRAADCLSRAITRAVYFAEETPGIESFKSFFK